MGASVFLRCIPLRELTSPSPLISDVWSVPPVDLRSVPPVPILAGHRESMLVMTHVDVCSPVQYAKLPAGGNHIAAWSLREVSPPEPPKPRLLDRVRQALRARHMSRRTEEAYVAWIRRFIFFHNKRHPAEMGAPEVTKFLTSLAVDGQVAASTQNQAWSALLFLYKDVREVDLPWLDG